MEQQAPFPWEGFILLSLIAGVILAYRYSKKKNLQAAEAGSGLDNRRAVNCGTYLGGHPEISMSCAVSLYIYPESLKIATAGKVLGEIAADNVKNISIEDATNVHRRIGLKRMVLFGPLSLAMKKKVVEQHAFLTVEWNDGRFDHDTIFRFDNKGAMETANSIRNSIIRVITATKKV